MERLTRGGPIGGPPVPGLEDLDGQELDGLVFCGKAYDVFDEIRASPDGIRELRLLTSDRAKKVIEEILPLATYVQARYRVGVRLYVRWRGGNQPFDAEVRWEGDGVKHLGIPERGHIEITTAVAANEHLAREHLHNEGGSFSAAGTTRDRKTGRTVSVPTVFSNSWHGDLVRLIEATIAKKAQKSYPANTSLIVLWRPGVSVILDEDWEPIVAALVAALRPTECQFREVVLVEENCSRLATVYQPGACIVHDTDQPDSADPSQSGGVGEVT